MEPDLVGGDSEDLDPLALDHRGATVTEASPEKNKDQPPTLGEAQFPGNLSAYGCDGQYEGPGSHTVSCQDTAAVSFICNLGRVLGN